MSSVLYQLGGPNSGVATITMNRPEALNASNPDLSSELLKSLEQAAGDPQVRCIVLTGAGRGFCAGADLSQFTAAFEQGIAPPMASVLRDLYHPIIETMLSMPKPIVGAINGVAAGMGTSLAMACDFRIVSDKAKFTMAFAKIAVVPDSGSTYLLPRLVGLAKATELCMLSPVLDAAEMLRVGLATEVVPADAFAARVSEFAGMLAAGPTLAFGMTKQALRYGAEQSASQAMDYEADLQQQVAHSADMVEGISAFLGKREARFTGR